MMLRIGFQIPVSAQVRIGAGLLFPALSPLSEFRGTIAVSQAISFVNGCAMIVRQTLQSSCLRMRYGLILQ
ncbi:MAG: hypothetical protein OXD39_00100 [Gemmatimonadetes bacterium]|nr:hypothetical protein [Gemmatimonadota bacterium]